MYAQVLGVLLKMYINFLTLLEGLFWTMFAKVFFFFKNMPEKIR